MNPIDASYYDGSTSRRYAVTLQADDTGYLLLGDGVERHYRGEQIRTAYRVGKQVRRIEFTDGASLEAGYSPELDRLLDLGKGQRHQGVVHSLESKLKYIAIALLLTLAVAWAVLNWGIPATARLIAFSLPVETQNYLGQGTLKAMDHLLTSASKLTKARQQQLQKRFAFLTQGLPDRQRYKLVFRYSEKIGANAMALPSGTIVMTDGLVELAHNDEEIEAVLAHEIGHEVYRHSLRQALQSSSAAVIIAFMVGDVSSITSFATTLPTLLVNMNYSRQFETEADTYARQLMLKKGIALKHFADILTRLSQASGDEGKSTGFLSSHPATLERIKAFQ